MVLSVGQICQRLFSLDIKYSTERGSRRALVSIARNTAIQGRY